MRPIPSLNALRAFEAAARHQSFGIAADELCVTPAAISQQIKGLESYLGIRLFQRVGRRVTTTHEAKIILPELREAFALIEKSLSRLGDGETGQLTISTTLAFAAKWLLPRIHHFHAKHPDIDIRLNTNDRLPRFEQENVDAAIIFGSGDNNELKSLPIKSTDREKIIPVCSPQLLKEKKPLKTITDLKFHTLLHDDFESADQNTPNWGTWLRAAGCEVDANSGPHFPLTSMVLEAATLGHGVALVGRVIAGGHLASGQLV